MWRGRRVAVVMPARNEARQIARALRAVPTWVDAICVIDDGSADETGAIARTTTPAAIVLRHDHACGVGAAIAAGYARVFADGADIAVVMAGDGQMDPRDLPSLLDALGDRAAAYAKGDRLSWPGAYRRMPTTRFIGNHALSWLTRAALGVVVRDSQCGYTALTKAAFEAMRDATLWPRYGYPNDVIARLASADVAIVDVPVRPVYRDEESGVRLRDAALTVPFVIARAALRQRLPR